MGQLSTQVSRIQEPQQCGNFLPTSIAIALDNFKRKCDYDLTGANDTAERLAHRAASNGSAPGKQYQQYPLFNGLAQPGKYVVGEDAKSQCTYGRWINESCSGRDRIADKPRQQMKACCAGHR